MEHHLQAALIMIASHRMGKTITEVRSGEGTFRFYVSRLSESQVNIECAQHSGCRIKGSGSNWRFSNMDHAHKPGVVRKLTNVRFTPEGEFEAEYYDDPPYGRHRVKGSIKGNKATIVDYSKQTKTWDL